jgi:hypothetical protein
MKRLLTLVLLLCLLVGPGLRADEVPLQRFTPADFPEPLRAGEIARIENPGAHPAEEIFLLQLDAPKITKRWYALLGQVKYEGLTGNSYLEMWNHFAGGGAYFSRTLATDGPMAALHGTSGWRDFVLPFDSKGAPGAPQKLIINLELMGKGTVELRDVRLVEAETPYFLGPMAPAWLSGRQAGLICGLAGALLGCFGGLAEWLATRGKNQRFVTNGLRAFITLGALSLAAGAIAFAMREPFDLQYGLVLFGLLTVLILPFRLRRYRDRYREFELRRIQSLDAAV